MPKEIIISMIAFEKDNPKHSVERKLYYTIEKEKKGLCCLFSKKCCSNLKKFNAEALMEKFNEKYPK